MKDLRSAIDSSLEDISSLRRTIHARPELGYHEFETTRTLLGFLAEHGVEARAFDGVTGLVAEIGSGRGRAVGFRADIDALPVTEHTGSPFSSENPGVMHACGHDVHASIAAGLAVVLKKIEPLLPVSVRIIFQPAEECNPDSGSKKVVESGAVDGLGLLLGLHIWPGIPAGSVGIRPGYLMAASDKFFISINGKKSHAAEPHKGTDAITAGLLAVSMIKNIAANEVSPLEPAVISIGEFNSSGRYNIICDSVSIGGTIRTFEPSVRDHIHERIEVILDGLSRSEGVTCKLSMQRGYDAVFNDPSFTEMFIRSAGGTLGSENVLNGVEMTMVGEDFSFYSERVPTVYFFLGAGPNAPLHSDSFLPDDGVFPVALSVVSNFFLDLEKFWV